MPATPTSQTRTTSSTPISSAVTAACRTGGLSASGSQPKQDRAGGTFGPSTGATSSATGRSAVPAVQTTTLPLITAAGRGSGPGWLESAMSRAPECESAFSHNPR